MRQDRDVGKIRRGPLVVVILVVLGVASGLAIRWAIAGDADSPTPTLAGDGVRMLAEPRVLLRTPVQRDDGSGAGRLTAGSVVELAVDGEIAIIDMTASGSDRRGSVAAFPCGADPSNAVRFGFEVATSVSRQIVSAAGADGRVCVEVSEDVHLEAAALGFLTASDFTPTSPPAPLFDTRAGATTIDGEFVGAGPLRGGETIEFAVAEREGVTAARFGVVTLIVETIGRDADGALELRPCDASSGVSVDVRPNASVVRPIVVPIGALGTLCVSATAPTDLVVGLTGVFAASLARPFEDPVAIVDTRAAGETFDTRFAGVGVRPEHSTLEVPVTDRIGDHDGLVALVLDLTAAEPLDDGRLTVFPAGSEPGEVASLQYRAGETTTTTAIVPLAEDGEICVATTGRTDVVVTVMGLLTTPAVAGGSIATVPRDPEAATTGCPQQQLFPDRRLVAMYGSDRTPRLGVLGEQDAEAAAVRLAEIAAPWRDGDRPVQPAFELIATLATFDDGSDGLHRLRSSPEVVQRYLDVARRHGYYLILDIQPGWSDFLTEAMYYEEFLREPDVGLALDPEWKTQPPQPPVGGYVGQTSAAEVNAVSEWLARLVVEEDLPEKLLIVHQFQDRMVLERERLVEPPGIALTIHMDGFGSRVLKLDTWSKLRVEPPWSNGLKLFFDEDIDIFRADEILAGAFEPVPDLITYQ